MKETYAQWLTLYDKLLKRHDEYSMLLDSGARDDHTSWFVEANEQFVAIKCLVQEWFCNDSAMKGPVLNQRATSVVGSHRSRSSMASITSARLKEDQKRAELETRC